MSTMVDLPNLVYLGDVPVESTCHGSALLYRLLQNYPREKLLIVQSNLSVSRPECRIGHVRYAELPLKFGRLQRTRFSAWYSSWLTLSAGARAGMLSKGLNGFVPDAVLTVTHGHSWITAARFASSHRLPLHLICHDDWPRYANVIEPLMKHVDSLHGMIYRQAVSRLCVSPFMRDAYDRRYGVAGEVLYPSRASAAKSYPKPPERLGREECNLTVAFAGSINSHGYLHALKVMGECMEKIGGRLLIFGTFSYEDARGTGLDKSHIEFRGMLSSEELMKTLREEVDLLFVPMSFVPEDRANMEISFPSKLTDYTAIGLPLLIFGPAYCSAIQWALQHEGVAEIVDENSRDALECALRRLAADSSRRVALGAQALALGRQQFSHEVVQSVFQRALTRNDLRPDL
ncbi:MAG: hypothetical protein V4710_10075 [Verrucomicrobiota bacterium]